MKSPIGLLSRQKCISGWSSPLSRSVYVCVWYNGRGFTVRPAIMTTCSTSVWTNDVGFFRCECVCGYARVANRLRFSSWLNIVMKMRNANLHVHALFTNPTFDTRKTSSARYSTWNPIFPFDKAPKHCRSAWKKEDPVMTVENRGTS